jgi:uncharacterized protein (DUF1800 family)
LAQAGFGGNMADVTEVVTLGFEGWLNKQINMPPSLSNVDWLISLNIGESNNWLWPGAVWKKFVSSPDQLRQRLVNAWSQIFVVSYNGIDSGWAQYKLAYFQDILERHAFGNFRDLLEAVTLSPAMGDYLNMDGNKKADGVRQPDENFAREIMQLFTIGLNKLNSDGAPVLGSDGQPLPTYGEKDVQGLAAVFTGWSAHIRPADPSGRLSRMAYATVTPMKLTGRYGGYAEFHSTTEKNFLGTRIPADTSALDSLRIALDVLFNHPNTGPFIAIRLIQRLITSNPVPAYVKRVASVFADNGAGVRGDLAAVVKAIVLDPEARGQSVQALEHRGKLREPVLRFLQFCRTFNVKSRRNDWNRAPSTAAQSDLGQMPFAAPSVFNFYTYDYTPLNTGVSRAGLVAPEFNLVNEPNVVGYLNFMIRVINDETEFQPDHGQYEALAANPAALVLQLDMLFTGSRLSAATRNTITDAVGSIPVSSLKQRVRAATALIMASPDYLIQET